MRRFGGQSVADIMDRFGLEEDVPIEHGIVSKAIENAQVRVEGYNFDIRKHVLEYDDVVNKQREIIYNQRRQILSEPTMRPTIMGMIEDELRRLVTLFTSAQENERSQALERSDWDLESLAARCTRFCPFRRARTLRPGAVSLQMIWQITWLPWLRPPTMCAKSRWAKPIRAGWNVSSCCESSTTAGFGT